MTQENNIETTAQDTTQPTEVARRATQWAKFQTVNTAETQGVWYDFGNGASLLIARAGGANKAYEAMMTRLLRPLQRQIQTGTVQTDVLVRNNKQAYAETVVLDWKGVEHPVTGQPMPYSPKAVFELFEMLPEVWTQVVNIATDYSNFSRETIEAAAKN